MNSEQANQMRRKSMQGTVFLALALLAGIGFAITGSVWLIAAAVAFLALGVVMLYQVGKSLS